jgi:hypothetical protein
MWIVPTIIITTDALITATYHGTLISGIFSPLTKITGAEEMPDIEDLKTHSDITHPEHRGHSIVERAMAFRSELINKIVS